MSTFEITMRHDDVPRGLDGFVAEKVARLEKYFKDSTRIEFVLEKDHELFRCEAIVHDNRHGTPIVVHDSHEEIRASIDGVMEKMRAVLVKRKDRRKDHHRGHGLGEVAASTLEAGSARSGEESGSDEPSYEEIVNKEVKGE